MKKIILGTFLSLTLVGCHGFKYTLKHCSDIYESGNVCTEVAAFVDLDLCLDYALVYSSTLNYVELRKTGETVIRYSRSNLQERVKSQIFCQ